VNQGAVVAIAPRAGGRGSTAAGPSRRILLAWNAFGALDLIVAIALGG
jgi:hypothetical protein